MPTAKELREEFSKIHTEAQAAIDAAIAADTELTPEVKAANDKRFARLETIKNILDNQTKFAKLALEKNDGTSVTGPVDMPGKAELEAAAVNGAPAKLDRAEFSKAVSRWASTGDIGAKFATITTASQSGILLPVEVSQPLVPSAANVFRAALAAYGQLPITTPTTNEITLPVLSATSGSKVAETASSETEQPPSLTQSIVLKCATYSSGSAYFSNMVLAANDWDLLANTVPALAYSKELALESDAISAIIADAGITQTVTTATDSGFTYANLVSLDNALPKQFQFQKVIVLSQTAYSAAEGLTFASGPPVLSTDANGLKRFNGTPVLRSDYLTALGGAAAKVGFIMSLAGFRLRDAGQTGVTRYVQVPAKPNQTGINLFAYHSFGYAPTAMAMLITP